MTETAVTSFIIRFTQDQESDLGSPWRGFIHHVQADEETYFTKIEDALEFMGGFVNLNVSESLQSGRQNQQADDNE